MVDVDTVVCSKTFFKIKLQPDYKHKLRLKLNEIDTISTQC